MANPNVKVKVASLSGFDKSFHNLLTAKCGTLVPVLTDLVIPGEKIRLNYGLSASMPPLASDVYGKMSIRTEAFFVPMRLLNGGFEDFFIQKNVTNGSVVDNSLMGACPVFAFANDQNANSEFMKAGSLPDYLGFKVRQNAGSYYGVQNFSLMPFLAYHRIYDDWYKNGYVQKDVFVKPVTLSTSLPSIKHAPFFPFRNSAYTYVVDSSGGLVSSGVPSAGIFDDGVSIFGLRQRNFGDDYFTLARPDAQFGDDMSVGAYVVHDGYNGSSWGQKVEVEDDGSGGYRWDVNNLNSVAKLRIPALRAANSLQMYRERKNLAKPQYVEQIFSQYGVRPSDGVAQRAIFLGGSSHEIYSKGVYQSSNTDGSSSTQNPFAGSVGAEYGSARASGVTNDFVSFEAKEPGYIMVLASLVPRVSYGSGISRFLTYFGSSDTIAEMPNHILQNTGYQEIYNAEISDYLHHQAFGSQVFGYTQRYADFMTKTDEIHGLFRDSQNLRSFALQRNLGGVNTLNSTFLQIPTGYLDQVAAVSGSISGFGYWLDMHFDYKIVAPLEQYSLPSLQDPAYEHGKDVVLNTRGSNL